MQKSVLLCFMMVAVGFLSSFEAKAQVPLYDEAGRSYETRTWQFDLQTTYYQATANYKESGGQYDDLPSGFSYNLLDFDLGVRWIPTSRWGVYTSTRLSNAESKDPLNTRRNSGFSQAVVGSDFLLYSGKSYELIPDVSVTLPFNRVDAFADEVLNSEGAIEANGRLIGRAHWGRWSPFAFAGFTYRDEDRASLLPYGAGLEMSFARFSLGGEIRGYETVIKDKFTNERQKREAVAAKNGGALRYYSVDPSLLETNVWLRSQLNDSWGLKVGGGTSLTGASTSAGWNVIAGISYSFVPTSTPTRPVSRPLPPVEDPVQFQEETNDGVDQQLFRPPDPVEPPPVLKVRGEDAKKKLQKELNQTEFQIELKHTKKPRKKRR